MQQRWPLLALFLALLSAGLGCSTAVNGFREASPEVLRSRIRDGTPNFDYTIWLDCTIRNNGDDGQVVVIGELENGGVRRKQQSIFMESETEMRVTISFPEVIFRGAGLSAYSYQCIAFAS